MKNKVNITLDTNLYNEAKRNGINISKACNDALQSVLTIMKSDATLITERIVRMNLERSESELVKLQGEVNGYRSQLVMINEMKSKKEEETLKKEKEQIEKTHTCVKCRMPIDENLKKHTFKSGVMCNACMLTMTGDEYKRYSNG